jgi:hypothetical protein
MGGKQVDPRHIGPRRKSRGTCGFYRAPKSIAPLLTIVRKESPHA